MVTIEKKTSTDGETVEYVKTDVRLVENDRLVAPPGHLVSRDLYERLTGEEAPTEEPQEEPEPQDDAEGNEDDAEASEDEPEGDDTPDESEDDSFDSQQQAADDVAQYHTGSGWYELPNGERVRGKEAAIEAAAKTTEEDK